MIYKLILTFFFFFKFETALQLRVLAALEEDLSWRPGIHIGQLTATYNCSSGRSNALPLGTNAHAHTDT